MVTETRPMIPAAMSGATISVASVRRVLATVHDPEIPTVSIVDLGLVHDIQVAPNRIAVELLPTFVACPALEVIRSTVVDALSVFGRPADVTFTFAVPWTTERLTPAGAEGLRRAGIAPPAEPSEVRCPFCASARVAMDSAFGPALCRSLFYCRDCRQPFEAFKPV